MSPFQVLSLRLSPPATTRVGTFCSARSTQALGLVDPSRMGHHDQLVDLGRDEGLHASKEDLLTGQAKELLGDLASEPVPVSAREQDRRDEH